MMQPLGESVCDAGLGDRLRGDASRIAEQSEQDVLGADRRVAGEVDSRVQDVLHPRREPDRVLHEATIRPDELLVAVSLAMVGV